MGMEKTQTIAIVGAGAAGSWLAWKLAESGRPVLLFDHRAPWEKPCGGGLTAKVFWDFPELRKLDLQGRQHHRCEFVFPSGRRISLGLSTPLITVSRKRLGDLLLSLACKAGAEFLPEKVHGLAAVEEGWIVQAGGREYPTGMVVGADGVNSVVRKTVAHGFEREDLCLAYSALIPGWHHLPLIIKFYKGIEGYAWIFPRQTETSVGLALGKAGTSSEEVSERLHEFIAGEFERRGLTDPGPLRPVARLLPSLREKSFAASPLCGNRWALVGDASGAADPLTGEGLYYAFVTSSLLASALAAGSLAEYEQSWKRMAAGSIAKVSKVTQKFYRPFVLRSISLLLTYSPAIRALTRDLISGEQRYDLLKARIRMESRLVVRETVFNFLARRRGERKKKR